MILLILKSEHTQLVFIHDAQIQNATESETTTTVYTIQIHRMSIFSQTVLYIPSSLILKMESIFSCDDDLSWDISLVV